jgi:hypothetical protein
MYSALIIELTAIGIDLAEKIPIYFFLILKCENLKYTK